jgi:hypothetical protein
MENQNDCADVRITSAMEQYPFCHIVIPSSAVHFFSRHHDTPTYELRTCTGKAIRGHYTDLYHRFHNMIHAPGCVSQLPAEPEVEEIKYPGDCFIM